MTYEGHIEKGVVIIDENVDLQDGTKVRVEIVKDADAPKHFPTLRGKPYRYDDPFGPACPESDWDVLQ